MTEQPTHNDIARVALQVFFRIATRWELKPYESAALLGVSESDFYQIQAGETALVTQGMLTRISHLAAIVETLHCLLPEQNADSWVRRANTGKPFAGASALERMLADGIDGLLATRSYLEGQLYG